MDNTKHKIRVLLIVASAEYGYGYINSFFWQRGLLYLAEHLKESFGNSIEIKICDGNIRPYNECLRTIAEGYQIIGFHCVDHTKKYTLELASYALKNGTTKIIFGGSGAIWSPEQYLNPFLAKNQDEFIGCCTGSGEKCLEEIIKGTDPQIIPNLVYLKNDKILFSGVSQTNSISDYNKILPWEIYQEDIMSYIYNQMKSDSFPYQAISYGTLSHLGCIHRNRNSQLNRGCSFCAIPFPVYHSIDTDYFWEDVNSFELFLKKIYDSSYKLSSIKDWGDSISIPLLKSLLKSRPRKFRNISFSCYLAISEVNLELLELLKEMNCHSLFIGIDGIDNESLKKLNKPYSEVDVWNKLEIINRYNFLVEFGLILGIENQNIISLNNSVASANRIKKMFDNKMIVIQGNIQIPMPGSQIFTSLEKLMLKNYQKNPIYQDVEQRVQSWIEDFTQVTYEQVLKAQKQIETISPRKHSYLR